MLRTLVNIYVRFTISCQPRNEYPPSIYIRVVVVPMPSKYQYRKRGEAPAPEPALFEIPAVLI